MKKIVVINGRAGVGKDTVTSVSKKLLQDTSFNVFNFSSIDEVKHIATMMGWNGKKDEKSRKFLSDLKKLWILYNDKLFQLLKTKLLSVPDYDSLVFLHIREPNEIEKIKNNFGNVITLLIRRNQVADFYNESDRNVENYYYDYIIENNQDLSNLENSVKIFLNDILGEYNKWYQII